MDTSENIMDSSDERLQSDMKPLKRASDSIESKSKRMKIMKDNSAKKKSSKFQKKTGNTSSKKQEKPDWTVIKQKKKELRVKRKESEKPYSDVIAKTKRLWEQLRCDDCPQEKRIELSYAILDILKDLLQKVVFAHDMSRIVQWLLKLGTPDIRTSIVEILQPIILEMVQKRYASPCVTKMLKYCSNDSKALVINALLGNIVKLMSHSVASPVVDVAYTDYATSEQKRIFHSEFLGNNFKLSHKNVKSIAQALSECPDMKNEILISTKNNLLHVINKGLIFSKLVQAVIWDFLNVCTIEDKKEILDLLQPFVTDLIATKDGVRISIMCCWHSSTKGKKTYMKKIKGSVQNIATMEHGHMFLFALLDTVDDTVMLNKAVLSEIMKNVVDIARNEYGRRVILYIIAHRDLAYFHPALIDFLKTGDSAETMKKDMNTRKNEILEIVLSSLLEVVASDPQIWFTSSSIAMVVLAIMKNRQVADGMWLNAAKAIARHICKIDITVVESEKEFSLIEHPGMHRVFKKLLQVDKLYPEKAHFSTCLAEELNEETMLHWLTYNRGCFTLLYILESSIQDAIETLIKKFSKNIMKSLQVQTSVGAKLLVKKVSDKSVTLTS